MQSKLKYILISALLVFGISQLVGCSHPNMGPQDGPPTKQVNVAKIPNAVPQVEPRSRYGNPPSYSVYGRRYYVLKSAKGYNKTGVASWYGSKFHGQLTSTREPYDMFAMTAASTNLPLPTFVKVTNLKNGRWIIVKVNDRGPFDKDRIIDLSYVAAKKLGYANKGTALVRVTAIDAHAWQLAHAHTPKQQKRYLATKEPKLYLQVGAFRDLSAAKHLQVELAKVTPEHTRIDIGNYKHARIYRVQFGPLKTIAENDNLQKLLARKGFGRGLAVVV